MNPPTTIDFTSRLSARAITAGVFAAFALMLLFMSFAAGLGLWTYDINGYIAMHAGLWLYSFTAWAVSLYIGSYVAALASRSSTPRDGNLHGFTTWSVASVLICAFQFSNSGGLILERLNYGFYFAAFMGDAIALAAALAGGALGARTEMIFEDREKERIRTLESQRLNQAYPRP